MKTVELDTTNFDSELADFCIKNHIKFELSTTPEGYTNMPAGHPVIQFTAQFNFQLRDLIDSFYDGDEYLISLITFKK